MRRRADGQSLRRAVSTLLVASLQQSLLLLLPLLLPLQQLLRQQQVQRCPKPERWWLWICVRSIRSLGSRSFAEICCNQVTVFVDCCFCCFQFAAALFQLFVLSCNTQTYEYRQLCGQVRAALGRSADVVLSDMYRHHGQPQHRSRTHHRARRHGTALCPRRAGAGRLLCCEAESGRRGADIQATCGAILYCCSACETGGQPCAESRVLYIRERV